MQASLLFIWVSIRKVEMARKIAFSLGTLVVSILLFAEPHVARAEQAGSSPAAQTANSSSAGAVDPTKNGEVLFATSCGWCHSNGGREAGRCPKLAGSTRSDDFIINRIKNGKEGRMPAFGQTFNDAQIQNILRYIRSLQP